MGDTLTLVPHTQGRLIVISGPVKSGKTTGLEGILDAAVDSGLSRDSNIFLVKHPRDDKGSLKIGRHKAVVTDDPDEIADLVKPTTKTIIIAGAAHYKAPRIVHLVDAAVRSGRDVIVTALNLDAYGRPYGHLTEIMALADEVIVEKAMCSSTKCGREATRSKLIGKDTYEPRCTHHYHFDGSPGVGSNVDGYLELFLGPMFASKSLNWREAMRRVERTGAEYIAFKWLKDTRGDGRKKLKPYDTGYVELKNGEKIPALLVRDAKDIRDYLMKNPRLRNVFVDELQFISGIYDLVFDLMPRGYRFYGTGLPRPFKRTGFGEVPALMCLADRINMLNSYCVICHAPATENQRMKVVDGGRAVPAHFRDPLVIVGGGKNKKSRDYYEPRCMKHWELPGEPKLRYRFPTYAVSS